MSVKSIDYRLQTRLPVKDLALLFREGINARPSGLVGFVASKGLDWEFFSPEEQNDPFSAFDEDKPDFSVAAAYGLRRATGFRITDLRRWLEAHSGGVVMLSIWDRGSAREALLRHAGDLSPASKRIVDEVVRRLSVADGELTVTKQKGRLPA